MNDSKYNGHQNIKGREREPKPDCLRALEYIPVTLLHMNKHMFYFLKRSLDRL